MYIFRKWNIFSVLYLYKIQDIIIANSIVNNELANSNSNNV